MPNQPSRRSIEGHNLGVETDEHQMINRECRTVDGIDLASGIFREFSEIANGLVV